MAITSRATSSRHNQTCMVGVGLVENNLDPRLRTKEHIARPIEQLEDIQLKEKDADKKVKIRTGLTLLRT